MAPEVELEELTVADVIVPRVDVVGLPVEISVGEALAVVRKNKHTRYPVYEGSIDKVVFNKGKVGPVTAAIKEAYMDVVHGRNKAFEKYLTYVN